MAVKTLNIGSKKRGYWVALGFGKSESGGGKGFTCTIKTRMTYTDEMQAIATAKGWTLSN